MAALTPAMIRTVVNWFGVTDVFATGLTIVARAILWIQVLWDISRSCPLVLNEERLETPGDLWRFHGRASKFLE